MRDGAHCTTDAPHCRGIQQLPAPLRAHPHAFRTFTRKRTPPLFAMPPYDAAQPTAREGNLQARRHAAEAERWHGVLGKLNCWRRAALQAAAAAAAAASEPAAAASRM